MIQPRLFLCGDVPPRGESTLRGRRPVVLATQGHGANINLCLYDVAKVLLSHLSPRLVDLLEIAAYVFAADCATPRGEGWADDETVEQWSRDFAFEIAVRDLGFWTREDVIDLLIEALGFLSDDRYEFTFHKSSAPPPTQAYLNYGSSDNWPFQGIERVLMFSGGLDSLAGALETAAEGKPLVLVSHRSVATTDKRLRDLCEALRRTVSVPIIHIPVWVNKAKRFGREHTQRTRSLLFSALGTVVGQSIGVGGVRFFENGIVSLNFPVADEVLRARASRTTHPAGMTALEHLYRLVTERDFAVDNPFVFNTKADVLSLISQRGGSHLIKLTCSCARPGHFKSKTQWHCGACSQCIDRRVAVLATSQEAHDPAADYVSDVLVGRREEGYARNMAVNYARHARELAHMGELEMLERFNLELSRAARVFPNPSEAADRMIEMHCRHGETVMAVLTSELARHASDLLMGRLDRSAMLSLVADSSHLQSLWNRYCDEIVRLLSAGLPIACRTRRPDDERQLQALADAILNAQARVLDREFPYVRWSSSLAKADWSDESLGLWIEAKYVRRPKNIHRITEEIAADITKYGDNGRRALFVIYDPERLIDDDREFAEPITKRETMRVCFIR